MNCLICEKEVKEEKQINCRYCNSSYPLSFLIKYRNFLEIKNSCINGSISTGEAVKLFENCGCSNCGGPHLTNNCCNKE